MWRAYLGQGFCRDASGQNPWESASACVPSLAACEQDCYSQPLAEACACFAYAPPEGETFGCNASLGRCVVYRGEEVATQVSAGQPTYVAYANAPGPTPPPPSGSPGLWPPLLSPLYLLLDLPCPSVLFWTVRNEMNE